ncbi:MAG: TetR/AcrR family transcriptional regulator [Halieaceae bacterium]|nr:TetR/AcrR family transcriptional regulator [Halieaceae bacterium]
MTSDSASENSGGPSPFNRTAQRDAKRSAILSQAAKLFNYQGSRGTTLQDIASSLGLTKTSLYYYVKTKEDLIYQCYRVALAHHHSALDKIEQDTTDPRERAAGFLRQHFVSWGAAQNGNGPHIAALMEIAALKGQHKEEIEAQYIALFKRVRANIRTGVADGSLRPCESTATTRAIMGSLDWTFFWLHSVPLEQLEDTADAALDILANGLASGEPLHDVRLDAYGDCAEESLEGFNREETNRLKQEAFYKTGTRFFNRRGFNGASLDEIAEDLKVSKGAFYYHIKSKEDLLLSCYKRSLDILGDIHHRADKGSDCGLIKAQRICLEAFRVQISADGPLIRYNTITALPMARRLEILKQTDALNAHFGQLLEQGIEDGSVRPINIFIARQLIAGAINAAMEIGKWRAVNDAESTAIDYFNVLFNGLLPRAAATD